MQPISTYGSLLTQINAMTNASQLSSQLSLELSTNKVSVDFAGNPNRAQVLDLTGTQDQLNSYVQSCTTGAVTTSLYSNSLSQILTVAQSALSSVQGLMSSYTGLTSLPASWPAGTVPVPGAVATSQNEIDAYNAYQSMGQTIDQVMTETGIDLNEQTPSGGYLYAGLRNPTDNPPQTAGGTSAYLYNPNNPTAATAPPVIGLQSMPYFSSTGNAIAPIQLPNQTAAAAITGYVAPQAAVDPLVTSASATLPAYDVDYATAAPASANYPTAQTMAWGTQSVTVDQNQTVGVNISSTNPAFQNLINGLRAAKTAADQAGNYTTADRDSFMQLAYSSLNNAVTGIEALQNQNDLNQETFLNKTNIHNTNLTTIATQLTSITAVDTTTVTTQLATVNDQLNASYKVTADLLGMSLLTYLK